MVSRFLAIVGLALALICAVDAFSGSVSSALISNSFLRLAQSSSCRQSNGGLSSLQMAHHPRAKGAKEARKNRPKKKSLSDINRKPPPYDVNPMEKARQEIPEYTVIGQADMSKYFKIEKEGKVFYHVKEPHS